MSQNLEDLQWKKRVIVIYAPSFDNKQAQEQRTLLKADLEKFEDYKLSIIEYTSKGKREDFGIISIKPTTDDIKNFKIVLIGLDGGVKFESNTVQPSQKFFDLINTMPMRRNELRGNN